MKKINYGLVPEKFLVSMQAWISKGEYPGPFIASVLENKLSDAVVNGGRDMDLVQDLIEFLLTEAPKECWGSQETMKSWTNERQRMLR